MTILKPERVIRVATTSPAVLINPRRIALGHALCLLTLGAALLTSPHRSAEAATVSWTNGAGGTWTTGTNWSTGAAPAPADFAQFSLATSNYTVATGGPITIAGLLFGDGTTSTGNVVVSTPGGNNFTIDSAGIEVKANSGNVTIQGAQSYRLQANQTWRNDSAGLLTVTRAINSALTNAPGGNLRLTVAGSGAVEFTGSINMNSTATVSLVKSGNGTLTLSGTNSNTTGSFTLTGGTLAVASLANGGVNSSIGASTSAAGNLVFNGGTLRYTGTGAVTNRAFTINNGRTATIDTATSLAFAGATGATTTGSLTKTGAGRLTLTGSNTYTGATLISGGQLTVESLGSLNGTSGISLNGGDFEYNSATTLTPSITFSGAGGTLSGTGTIGSAVTVGTGAVLSPGNSPGTQSFTNGLAWNPGGTYVWELNALSGTAGTNWDLLNVSGGTFDISALSAGSRFNLDLVTLNGSNAAGPLDSGYTPGSTYEFLVTSFATLGSGTNAFGPNSDLTGLFEISLAGWQGTKPSLSDIAVKVNAAGNGIQLVIVPEPGTIVFAGLGIAMAGWSLWNRRRKVLQATRSTG